MISFEDCKGLCGLSEAEIRAIAQHEHLPEMVATEMGAYLLHKPGGEAEIRRMIEDDIVAARAAGEAARVFALRVVLHKFVCEHAAADRRRAEQGHLPERRG